jgi:protein involved in ribonucleotide reduction
VRTVLDVVYFSSTSENTKRFVDKLATTSHRIPLHRTEEPLTVTEPYVLIVPTYGAGKDNGAVPKQVIRFLNNPSNRTHLVGIVTAGNTNFGNAYGLAGRIIAAKTNTPVLYQFEVLGTPEDVDAVRRILTMEER